MPCSALLSLKKAWVLDMHTAALIRSKALRVHHLEPTHLCMHMLHVAQLA